MGFPLRVAIAGLGNRGRWTYAKYAQEHPEQMKIVAVADLVPERVQEAAATFGVPQENCFASAAELVQQDKLADILFVCTPDREHYIPAIEGLKKGYHLLLEKPISPTVEECTEIARLAKEKQRHVVVCHVLRYTPFFTQLKQILDSGRIGEIVTIQAIENVGYYHQAHSFVRGNWRNSELSSPMILQKCCHDMDILLWLSGRHIDRVSSYGDINLFKAEKAPAGAAKRCLDGCKVKENCPYDAEKIYITDDLTGVAKGKTAWPNNVLTMYPTVETVRRALEEGPYGRCVYHCDNNVVDHQVVNLELEDKSTISFTMSGLTSSQYRALKIMGTMGDIEANMETNLIEITEFGKEKEVVDIAKLGLDLSGHAGGDMRMVEDLLRLVSGESTAGGALTSVQHSLESHLACFASEYSRTHQGESITLEEIQTKASR